MSYEDKIGSLWKKESKKGKKFLTGVITVDGKEIRVVGFINTNKRNDKAPDVELYKSKPFNGGNPNAQRQKEIVEDLF